MKLIRPLDFIVISDHAENLGLADFIRRSDPILLANKTGKKWHDWSKAGKGYDAFLEWLRSDKEDLIKEPRMMQSVWAKVVANADKYNQPGVFTAFHGFEWTSMPDGNNLHRVVIFRDAGDKTSQVLPYSMYDSVDPEGLWDYMAAYEQKTGGQVLAIPHNGNLSNGLMYDVETYSGKPLSKSTTGFSTHHCSTSRFSSNRIGRSTTSASRRFETRATGKAGWPSSSKALPPLLPRRRVPLERSWSFARRSASRSHSRWGEGPLAPINFWTDYSGTPS